MNMPPCANQTRPRQHIGWLEEYWLVENGWMKFAGHRGVEFTIQKSGSENIQDFVLAEDVTINRSFSKVVTLKAGTHVKRMVSPLQGREV